MPLAFRLAIVLAAILAGGIGALILLSTRRPADGDEPEDARHQRQAGERDTAATAHLQAALNACRSLPARLTHIADAADAKAVALRDAHAARARRRPVPRQSRLAAPVGAAPRQPTAPHHRLAAAGPSL